MRYKTLLAVLFLLLITFCSRIYGFNWDAGFHLHPDERAIILYTLPLHFPQSLSSFLSISSPLNPHFFAYGSLPMYLLSFFSYTSGKIVPFLATYDGMQFVGRSISLFAEMGIVVLLFFIGKLLFHPKTGFLAACFYILSTLPLQLAHFYAVDTLLTFFILLALTFLLAYSYTSRIYFLFGVSIATGLALATKVSASMLLAPIFLTFLLQEKSFFHHIKNLTFSRIITTIGNILGKILLIVVISALTFIICEPYALIDFPSFWSQTNQQSQMTKDAFTFPYTLQYVTITPYLYEISQLFFWGQGFILATICLAGTLFVTCFFWTMPQRKELGILLSFFWIYFLVVGGFAVAFMRYMLPLYPLLCLLGAALTIYACQKFTKGATALMLSMILVLISIWPASFLRIYASAPTRVQATDWILQHIPPGKTLAVEHWDDQIPLSQAALYPTEILELYNPDTPEKWEKIHSQLARTDYLILASNRLYTPLQKLTDCQKLKPHPCYKQTTSYYQDLFAGRLGFKKVAEFTAFPTIPFLNIIINDQGADESFTVYDHPVVIIFQKQD